MSDPIVQFFFKNPIGDGGTFCGVSDLVDKYGLVPMEVMPETYSAENTSRMARLVSSKLREYGLELRKMVAGKKSASAIKARKTEMLGNIYNILVLSLGEPVKTFEYAFKDKDGKQVGKPVEQMHREDKIKFVRYLDQKGAFLITKAAERIYEYLGVSRFTLYNYLDIVRKETNAGAPPQEESTS